MVFVKCWLPWMLRLVLLLFVHAMRNKCRVYDLEAMLGGIPAFVSQTVMGE